MLPNLTLAAISLTTTSDKPRNIAQAVALVEQAAAKGADWIQLPEMFPFMGGYDLVHGMAEVEGGELHQTLAKLAAKLKIVLFAGSVGERPGDEAKAEAVNSLGQKRVYNTAYVFGRDGTQIAKYRKTHLFNLNGDDGRPRYCESDGFLAGSQAVTLKVDGYQVAMAICYDLRFPELFAKLAADGAPDVMVLPSAFTKATGKAHWELLLRARAVENQAYVFAANQTGVHAPGKESFGHAVIVDPWGDVVADTGDQPGIAIAKISGAKLAEVRGRLPALANRRPSLY